jgi:cold shock CspA family protein
MTGKIQMYNEMRGFGFILQDFRTKIFFHVNKWESNTPPVVGMAVTYDEIPSGKAGFKNQAANVRPTVEVIEALTSVLGGAQ